MKKKINDSKVEDFIPKKQLILFGYRHYFESFIKLLNKEKLPFLI